MHGQLFILPAVMLVALVLMSGILALVLKWRNTDETDGPPSQSTPAGLTDAERGLRYQVAPAFLSDAERSFFGVLCQSLASEYHVFAKVRLADIIHPVRGASRSAWQSTFNKIAGKHVDFLVCDKTRVAVVAVVELDDRSHGTLEAGFRDAFVDSALSTAKIPILRVPARQFYSPDQLRNDLEKLVRRAPACPPAAS